MACVDIPVAAGTSGRLATNQCAQDSDSLANPEWRDRLDSKSSKPTVDKSIFTLTPKIDFPASLNQLPEEAVDVNQNLRLQPAGLSVLRNLAKSSSNFPSNSILEKSAAGSPGYTNPAVMEPSLTNRLGWEESHVREELADTIVRAAQRPTAVERAVVGETIEAEEMGHDTFSSATSKQNSNMKKFGITSVNIVPSASLSLGKGVDALSSDLPPLSQSAVSSKKGVFSGNDETVVGDLKSAKAINRAKAVIRQAREEVNNELATSGSEGDAVDPILALAVKKDLAAIAATAHPKPKRSDKEYIRLTKAVGKPGLVDRVEQEDIIDSVKQGEKWAKDATSAKARQAVDDLLASRSKFPPNMDTEHVGNAKLRRKIKAAVTGGAAAVESASKAKKALQRLVRAAAARAIVASSSSGSDVPSTGSGSGSAESAESGIFMTTTTVSPMSTTVSPLNSLRSMLKPEGMHGSGSGSSSGSGGSVARLKPFLHETQISGAGSAASGSGSVSGGLAGIVGSGSSGSVGSDGSSGLLHTTAVPIFTTPPPLGGSGGSGSASGPVSPVPLPDGGSSGSSSAAPVPLPDGGSSGSSSAVSSPLGNPVFKPVSSGSGSGSDSGSSASGSVAKLGSDSGSASGSSPTLPTLRPFDLFSSSTGPAY